MNGIVIGCMLLVVCSIGMLMSGSSRVIEVEYI